MWRNDSGRQESIISMRYSSNMCNYAIWKLLLSQRLWICFLLILCFYSVRRNRGSSNLNKPLCCSPRYFIWLIFLCLHTLFSHTGSVSEVPSYLLWDWINIRLLCPTLDMPYLCRCMKFKIDLWPVNPFCIQLNKVSRPPVRRSEPDQSQRHPSGTILSLVSH